MTRTRCAALLVFLTAVACRGNAPLSPPPTLGGALPNYQFALGVGEQVYVQNAGFYLTFDGVGRDTRCPRDATCVWAGNAIALVSVRRQSLGNSEGQIALNTFFDPRAVTVSGWIIELVSIDPAWPDPAPKVNLVVRPG